MEDKIRTMTDSLSNDGPEISKLRARISELEQKLQDLSRSYHRRHDELFHKLGRRLSAASSDAEVSTIIFETARELIGWDSCFLGIYNKESDTLTTIIECDTINGETVEYPDRYFQRVNPGPLTRHILKGNSLAGNRSEVLTNELRPNYFGNETLPSQSILYSPLCDQRGQPLGVMTIQSYAVNMYSSEHLELFNFLAEFCGEAIARSYTETKLRLNEERLNFALSGTNVGVWDWNLQTDHITYTPQFAKLVGYLHSEIDLYDNFWRHATLHEDMAVAIQKLNEHISGRTAIYEHRRRMRCKDGEVRWFLDRGKTVAWDSSGQPIRVTGTITDITDELNHERLQKTMEDQLQEAQKMESLGLLAGGIAHDFNNLLLSIMGNLDMALAKTGDRSVRELLEGAEAGASQAAELTQQILAYAGKANFRIERFSISDLVRQMTRLLTVSIPKKVNIALSLDDNLPLIEGDLIQFRQVIMNLITNASDAIMDSEGEIQISTSSIRKVRGPKNAAFQNIRFEPGRYICLEIADTGCGMDEETVQKIFDPFFTTKKAGKGLGLAATVGIVKSHGGFMEIESEVGQGTSFRILMPRGDSMMSIPVKQKPQEQNASNEDVDEKMLLREFDTPPAEEKEESANIIIRNVLLVDDEDSIRTVAGRMLEHAGISSVPAVNGLEATKIFDASPDDFDIVLLDFMMPVMNGEEVYQHIRKTHRDIPVLFSSGYNENITESKLHLDSKTAFIQKPYRKKQLLEKMQELMKATRQSS